MADPLDDPVWHSLTGPQAHLAQRHGRALRIDPDYGPFAAVAPEAASDLLPWLHAGYELWVVGLQRLTPPPGAQVVRTAALVQMVMDASPEDAPADARIVELGEADAADMATLAEATRPGPWGAATAHYGPFYGIRREGGLAAMAGERMRPAAGLAEVSGVCTWPSFQGQGLAASLIRRVMAGFAARGDRPFLHSYAGNAGAIRLYESLGFRVRREMMVTVLGKAA